MSGARSNGVKKTSDQVLLHSLINNLAHARRTHSSSEYIDYTNNSRDLLQNDIYSWRS